MITQYHSIYPGLVTQTGHYYGDQEQDNISKIIYPGLSLNLVTIMVIRNKIMLITLLMMMNRNHEYVQPYQIYSKCSLYSTEWLHKDFKTICMAKDVFRFLDCMLLVTEQTHGERLKKGEYEFDWVLVCRQICGKGLLDNTDGHHPQCHIFRYSDIFTAVSHKTKKLVLIDWLIPQEVWMRIF